MTFFSCTGCSLVPGEQSRAVQVLLPEFTLRGIIESPSHAGFRLFYPGCPEGGLGRQESGGFLPGEIVKIETEHEIFPVTAYPLVEDCLELYPAGGIYPQDLEGENLALNWEDGYAAYIISRIIDNGIDAGNFNTGRFEKTLLQESEGNPWALEDDDIVYSLSFGIFNSNFIRLKKAHDIQIPLPEGSCMGTNWFSSNILDSRIYGAYGGMLLIHGQPERNCSYYCDDMCCRIQLYADTAGWSAWFSSSGTVLCGSW